MLEDLPKLPLLQANPSWCCRQEGGAWALRRDGAMGTQRAGVSKLGQRGSHPAPPASRDSTVPAPGGRREQCLVSAKEPACVLLNLG